MTWPTHFLQHPHILYCETKNTAIVLVNPTPTGPKNKLKLSLEVYFNKDGDMPETATLNITKPPAFSGMSTQAYELMIEEELSLREQQIADEMQENNQTFMGVNAVMAQNLNERPKNFEPRRTLSPRIAAKNKQLRISAIRRYKQFIAYYKEALKKWKDGNRDVIFPPGTYALRIHAGVNVQPG